MAATRWLNLWNDVYKMPGQRLYRSRSFGGGAFPSGGYLDGGEKLTMQNLNERLAIYMDKVSSLEKANSTLEVQIKEWLEKQTPVEGGDYNKYYQVIKELQAKILKDQIESGKIVLRMDNIKLASEDFRLKYNNEQGMRMIMENDIQRMRQIRDELTVGNCNLELELEELQEQLIYLKKNHGEEVEVLRKNMVGKVSVEVDAVPGGGIEKVMADMRLQYEELTKKKQQEAKELFDKQTKELNMQVTVSTEEMNKRRLRLPGSLRPFETWR
ncbi:keratin, type I cytoskeletal 14-like [Microcaecilia unicolor]|uniref:Keratin, type I cytoskeletal 20 n=1 Tax=Microcaecilia unicolor TaxID=1415580 RepID=A0A6P7ZEX7_9AMPH|nr:keratin, type I cytoskeletal 14-like [Microcaecilia unicolor]